MLNITQKISKDGKKLVLEIDLTQDFGLSASGKTVMIASTKGNKPIGDTGAILGLNLYKYPTNK